MKYINKIILLSLLVVSAIVAKIDYNRTHPIQDCVPATLCRIFPQVSYDKMLKFCHTDRNTGTPFKYLLSTYSLLSTNELTPVYSRFSDYDKVKEFKIEFFKPYLWVGYSQGTPHCALIYFSKEDVVISNSQYYNGTTNYFMEYWSFKKFFNRTLVLLSSDDLSVRRIRIF